jgi:acetyltransferase-like isoleucine patch superfamily enzyme
MSKYLIYPHVQIGKHAQIEDFVIIGLPPMGKRPGELLTIIGDNAVIRSHTVIYAGNRIGDHFQTGHHVTVRECNVIGNSVKLGTGTNIEHHVLIEDEVHIHSQVFIPEFSILKNGCWIGPNVVLTNAKYPKSKDAKATLAGPVIENHAKIGANSTILPGITVGARSLIGAGTVVTTDVPPEKIVVGNPGRVIKDLDELNKYE